MKKFIKTNGYILYNKKLTDQHFEELQKECKGLDIELEYYQGEYQEKDVVAINFRITNNTYKECEETYRYIKLIVKQSLEEKYHELMKMKGETL